MRRGILFGGIGLFVALVAILGFGYWRENYARAQDTVAVIFGEPVTTGQLLERVRPRIAAFDRRIAAMRAAGLTQQVTQLQAQRSQLPETVLEDLIDERIVRREADGRGLEVTADEIDARLRRYVAESDQANQPQPTSTTPPTVPPDTTPTPAPTAAGTSTPRPTATPVPTLTEDRYGAALQAFLSQTNLSEEQMRRLIEAELYEEELRAAIGEEDVPASQEHLHVRHIVLKTEEEAREVLQQLRSGTPFEELAATKSQDTATRDKGGDLGWIPETGRDPAFDSAAWALEPGQTSEVVRTAAGWEIIEVLARDPERQVDPSLLEDMRRDRYSDWLSNEQDDSAIQKDLSSDESAWILQRLGGRPA